MNNDFSYKFGAVMGVQNDRIFYQATVPFRVLSSMLKLDDSFDVTKRSQRLVNKGRGRAVAKYLQKNIDGFYVIPPLVGFIEGDFEFEKVPLDGFEGLGRMKVSLDSRFKLFDGQHRAFGIREAIAIAPELAQQNVSIMFFDGLTLSQRQQAFHDINFTQKTPAAALCIAYNERDALDKAVIHTFNQSNLRGFIEYEKNVASGDSSCVYSLKTLKDFAINVIGTKELTDTNLALLECYTSALFGTVNIPGYITYIELINKQFAKFGFNAAKSIREHYIIGHAVTLKALGLLAKPLMDTYPDDWPSRLMRLKDLSLWIKNSDEWRNRCVDPHDKMLSNAQAVRLTLYKLKELCGMALSDDEQQESDSYFLALTAA
ncbi:DNA sulfur modification protein DndB [Shewanella glacialipiscicola]|uniref:DNA sulfur modification protein DndB n=1 Tax=Shewanella glacialipiscicola TaxID=614069 RepID=UPI003D7B243F